VDFNTPVFRTLRDASPLFARLEEEGADCLGFLEKGREERYPSGTRIVMEGQAAAFFIVLEGEVQARREMEGRSMVVHTVQAGGFFGDVPLLLGSAFFAHFDTVRDTRVFRLDEPDFWHMLAKCRTVTREVLRTMARRLKSLELIGQEQGKLTSLGSMAAGLAHELNNPAAAAHRAAGDLRAAVRGAQEAACALSKAPLPNEARIFIAGLPAEVARQAGTATPLGTLEQSDAEEHLAEWLDEHGVEDGWDLAPVLVRAGFREAWLQRLAGHLPDEVLPQALRWLERSLTTLELLGDVEKSSARIGDVVQSVRSYSFMDQAPRQEIDLHTGLNDTLAIMAFQLRGLRVRKEYDLSLPRMEAYGSELNQVWTNLLDNAADAAGALGEITIRTAREGDFALVEIRDNGPGIPEAVRERLFEPYFTTKAIGKGTGIGLVTSRRIVAARHGGSIEVISQPGDTRFQVRLPLNLSAAADAVTPTAADVNSASAPVPPPEPEPVGPAEVSNLRQIDALRRVPLLAPLIEEGGRLITILSEAAEIHLRPGELLGRQGDPPFFSVIVEGEVQITKRFEGQEISLGKQGVGAFLGEIPLLLGGTFVGSVIAVTDSVVYRFEPETFWKLIGACPKASRLVLSTLAERLQGMTSIASNQEKLSALGTLAAGLAHELNNPAAAARRAAAQLRDAVLAQQEFACQLGISELTLEQRGLIQKLQHEVSSLAGTASNLDPLAREDLADAVATWLLAHSIPDAWELAPVMAGGGLDAAWLERVRGELPASVLPAVLRWVERTLTVEGLLNEIEASTRRIATLVKAVKSYAYAERAPRQDVDLRQSLDDALTLVGHKLQGIRVVRDLDPDATHVPGYPSELSQVWVSLLDNAADALNGSGEIILRTAPERGHVLVEIGDNGPGVPQELQRRIWEPFFTTKEVGQGVGLGLVTSHRIIVDRHQGELRLVSQPGDTRVQVRLPLTTH
jgi:signal transduction histidine kinase